MEAYSTWGVIAEVAGWITIWSILAYFWLEAQALMTLSIFLWVDILFWLLDSYFVTKDTSSKKLVEWIARKFWRRALPFITIAVLKWIGYDNVETISTIVMSVLILSEWYSIIWHIYALNYKEKLPEIDALKWLITMVADLFKGQLNTKKPLDKKENIDEQTWGSIQ